MDSIHRNLTEWELCNREGWKVVAPSPASSMVLETGGKGRERDKHKMCGAECQSHWKQLLILAVLCQPHEFRPQGWHGPGAMEEADISLLGGWHWTAKHPSVLQLTEAACQTSSKGALQPGSVLPAGDCLSLPEERWLYCLWAGSLFWSFSHVGSLSY